MGALSADPFLTSQWWTVVVLGNELKLSSPLLFDIGVYLVVVGVLLTMLFALEEH
jgi:multicomponent Na+:H+ antiporter subunit B